MGARSLAPALAFFLALAAGMADDATAGVSTTWRPSDTDEVAHALLADPDWRAAAQARVERDGALRIGLIVLGGERATFIFDGELRRADVSPDFTLALSDDAALVVLHAPEAASALRCLFDDGALSVTPRAPAERVALRAYRATLKAECSPPESARPIGPRTFVLGTAIFDGYGSILGWRDEEAPRWLSRESAGVSRLTPEELPRADGPVDLGDSWRAALALRPLLERAADCPCAPSRAALLPAGDWRAALEADPRAKEAR